MSAKKRYEVRGMMEWHPEFRVGRSRLKVGFTGGHLCGGGCTPASFETSDPVVQKVIESSDAFRRGLIMARGDSGSDVGLGNVRDGGHPGRRPAGQDKPAEHGNTPMEFASLEAAQDFLQRYKCVRIDDMLTPEKCMAKARRLGIDLTIKGGKAS